MTAKGQRDQVLTGYALGDREISGCRRLKASASEDSGF